MRATKSAKERRMTSRAPADDERGRDDEGEDDAAEAEESEAERGAGELQGKESQSSCCREKVGHGLFRAFFRAAEI